MSDSDHESEAPEEKQAAENDLGNSDIVTKYRFASDIVNRTLEAVVGKLEAGKTCLELCKFGDELITGQCAGAFKSKKIDKGIAFPTCVSVNDTVCHFSPLESDDPVVLKAGDVVRVDLGCHIDGYIAQAAHTAVVDGDSGAAAGAGSDEAKEGEASLDDVVIAAHTATEVAYKLCRPGKKNTEITEAIKKVADAYGVNLVQGTLSHEVKRFVIDGNKVIIQKEDADNKVEEAEIEEGDAFCLDVCFSTGEGKPRETGARTTVFKRAVDETYRLKMKASRYVLNEVSKKHPTLPFTIRSLDDEKQARMGVVECTKHSLLHAYPVLCEREGAKVAHFKATVLVLSTGTIKITGLALPEGKFTSDKKVDEETAGVLASNAGKKRRRKKKKAAGAGAGEA